jgi:thiamine-phosphate pyrophosphorylase
VSAAGEKNRFEAIPAPLMLITDRTQARRPLVEVLEAAFVGGCRFVSVREKDLAPEARMALVEELLPVARGFGATLLVHGDIEAARRCDGMHLSAVREGPPLWEVRVRLGARWMGVSCHSLDEIRAVSVVNGLDYVTLGPIAPTKSKPGYAASLGRDDLRAASKIGVPVFALGGVDEKNVGVLRKAGASGIAVMGSVMRSDDVEASVRGLLEAWEEASL